MPPPHVVAEDASALPAPDLSIEAPAARPLGAAADAPVGLLLLDDRGFVHESNRAAQELLAAPAARLRGTHLLSLVHLTGLVGEQLNDRGWHVSGELDPLVDQVSRVVGRTRGGEPIEADLLITPFDAVPGCRHLAWIHDTRRLRRTLIELAGAKGRLQSLAERPEVAICHVDREGIVTTLEGGALTVAGIRRDEAVGLPVEQALTAAPALAAAMRRGLSGRTFEVLEPVAPRVLRVRVRPIRSAQGPVAGAVFVATDVTGLEIAGDGAAAVGLERPALLDRQGFEDAVAVCAPTSTAGDPLGIIHLRLEDVELLHASLGRAAVNALVSAAADRVKAVLPDRATLAHGDAGELLLMIDRLGDEGRARARGFERAATAALSAPIDLGGRAVVARPFTGVALAPHDGVSPVDLMRTADAALLRARSKALTGTEPSEGLDRLELGARLAGAIERGELHVRYQPIFWLARNQPYGVEALLRWENDELGEVPPGRFIPVAETTGLIEPLGEWVIGEMCAQAATWAERGIALQMNFNVSPQQLRRPGFSRMLVDEIRGRGLQTRNFTVEVTESAVVLDADRTGAELEEMRHAGVQVGIDDFGAHHASLSRLKDMPADILKIDRHLLTGVPQSPRSNTILTAVLGLADTLGLRSIAEGIETEGQRAFLIERGCPLGQGYKLGRPERA